MLSQNLRLYCKKSIVQVQVKQAFLTASPIPAKSQSLSPFPSPSLDLTITNTMFSEKVYPWKKFSQISSQILSFLDFYETNFETI